jgi:hypothetical protein
VFREQALPEHTSLFRIGLRALYLLDDLDAPDTLLRRIERFGLTGLELLPVWSSEGGPEDVNLLRPHPIRW